MPLEKILDLKMPEELIDDKRGAIWSTDTLLATFALDRGESHSTSLFKRDIVSMLIDGNMTQAS